MKAEYGLIFWVHLFIIGIGYASWALFDWRLVSGGMALYYLQLAVFGDCLMTRAQFGAQHSSHPRTTFYYHYLKKLGFAVTNTQVVLVADYIVPPAVLVLAVITQTKFGLTPLWL